MLVVMRDACKLIWFALVGLFRSQASLQAEILVLRHQLNVQRRQSRKRLGSSAVDRLIFSSLYGLVPSVLNALTIVRPETVIKWHRAGFRSYWRWKSRFRGGRPAVPLAIRQLIREMSIASPLWGAPRIHGELRKLGLDIGQTWPSIWPNDEVRRRRAGRRFFIITPMASQRWIYSSFRQSRFVCSMAY